MKRTLLGLAVTAVVLSGSAALADHVHSGCHGRPPAPIAPVPEQQGQYELRTVRKWVPGRSEQVWVPGRCFGHRRWQRCEQGRYVTRWIPGSFQDVQEYVWVQREERRWGVQPGQPEYRYDPYTQQYVPVVGAAVQPTGSYTVTSTGSSYGGVHVAAPVVSAEGSFDDGAAQVSAQLWFDPL